MNDSLGNSQIKTNRTIATTRRWLKWATSEWIVLLAIVLLAVFFFFYRLPMIPSELNIDEWSEAYDALDMIENGYKVFSPIN